jgi:DNA-binding transcriptional LysR family regulator
MDLNLLLTLDAIFQEGTVKGAAQRLGLSPSAVSHALGRARELLGDALVVRTPRGMVATTRGERIRQALERSLSDLESLLTEDAPFDAATARRTFTLAASDGTAFTLLPLLLPHLQRVAPGIRVRTVPLHAEVRASLVAGDVDLLFAGFTQPPEGGFYQQPVWSEDFVCVARHEHQALELPLTLEQYLALPHISIAPGGTSGSLVDAALARQGLRRNITLVVPHFLMAALLAAQMDLLLVLPVHLARQCAAVLPLRILPPPLDLGGYVLHQIWHERMQKDPGHQWLRRTVANLMKRHEDSGPGSPTAKAAPQPTKKKRPQRR